MILASVPSQSANFPVSIQCDEVQVARACLHAETFAQRVMPSGRAMIPSGGFESRAEFFAGKLRSEFRGRSSVPKWESSTARRNADAGRLVEECGTLDRQFWKSRS